MTIRIVSMAALAACMFAQAPGQPPAPPQPKTDAIQAYLALTDAQVQALQQLRQAEMQSVRPLRDQIAERRKALYDLTEAGSTDALALGKLLVDIESVRKQVAQLESNFGTQALNLLNATQKTKLKTLDDATKGGTVPQAIALQLLTRPEEEYAPGGPGPRGPRPPDGAQQAPF